VPGSVWTRFGLTVYKRFDSRERREDFARLRNLIEISGMNVNFFEWLRDGVRQSVLLGVSDAIEQIGSPADTDELHPNVAALLQLDPKQAKRGIPAGNRKRLGKSLKDMEAAE
jgi:hypothetical protein